MSRHRANVDCKFILTILISILLLPMVCFSQPQAIESNRDADACRLISERSTRMQCYETLSGPDNQTKAYGAMLANGWRLVRTPNQPGGVNAISISHAADTRKSDPNFAGIVLRCGENQIEILLVVIEPYPPNVKIILTTKLDNGLASTNNASIVPPGVMVRLSPEASTMIMEGQRAPDELDVKLASESGAMTRGYVKLVGLEPTIVTLKKLCASR